MDRLLLAIESLVARMSEQVDAFNALAKSMDAVAESNQMLIQAMAGEEGVEEADRYQTL